MTYLNIHTHTITNHPQIIEVVNQYPWDFKDAVTAYSIGIHPWYIEENRLEFDLDFITKKLQDKSCLALGECGLDKKIGIPLALQQVVFEKQLVLAQQYNKPVIVHCVAAFDELIATHKKMKLTVPVIIHGFTKSEPLAKQLVAAGFYLSFGKDLLKKPKMETVFKSVPDDRIFLETDTMVDETIQEVYALAAQYKGKSGVEMQELFTKNYTNVFIEKSK
ncbi:TatD family hydrolase [Flavobacterium sp. UMI-01]|uniref:TatD family hydrolase n=1 Tax=Flavobacterium sp. UMI-01 TaxID=1441053 RepID=UPI001C7DDD70|nr:TatD family hydrolase [Flavobacterium sp. UMI-01]GIZ08401.1 TatD family hydrolase [Flavobacterium sp. UMI-01]